MAVSWSSGDMGSSQKKARHSHKERFLLTATASPVSGPANSAPSHRFCLCQILNSQLLALPSVE